jgi:hypothetical protein
MARDGETVQYIGNYDYLFESSTLIEIPMEGGNGQTRGSDLIGMWCF